MSNPLQYGFTADEVEAIRAIIAPGASDAEMNVFLRDAQHRGLDPFARQIYLIERRQFDKASNSWGVKRSTQVSIDGFRLIAERTGKYQGQVGPLWCGPDGQWVDVWLKKEPPAAAKVGVLKSTFTQPLYRIAKWVEYAQLKSDGTPTVMWAKMPDLMLAKCAESNALRVAFPQELSGLYTREEMAQADNPLAEAAIAKPRQQQLAAPEVTIAETEEAIEGEVTEPKSYLDDDVRMSKLLEYLFAPDEGKPGVPMPIAKAYADCWRSRPDVYKDRQTIFDHALILRDQVRRWLVFDVNAMLKELGMERDEAKTLLDIGSFSDLLELRGEPPKATLRPIAEVQAMLAAKISAAPG